MTSKYPFVANIELKSAEEECQKGVHSTNANNRFDSIKQTWNDARYIFILLLFSNNLFSVTVYVFFIIISFRAFYVWCDMRMERYCFG